MNSGIRSLPKERRMLPLNFRPHENSVVIGKGKDARRAPGTQRLREDIERNVSAYKAATRRLDKALVVSEILFRQNQRCPMGGAFVKFDGNCWWEVSEHDARENITACFRNRLHENYKSSSKYKSAKRRSQQRKQLEKMKSQSSHDSHSHADDSSHFSSEEDESILSSFPPVQQNMYQPTQFMNNVPQNSQGLDNLRSLPISNVEPLFNMSLIEPTATTITNMNNDPNGDLWEPIDPHIFDWNEMMPSAPGPRLQRQTTFGTITV
eukprot:Nitzschia sp. Nitz4//scaffold14_size191712//68909//69703//NITZ4_001715-RA/size191712-processed-gene-0.308-mRNA-1//-1//CDS//3329536903//8650//frame0